MITETCGTCRFWQRREAAHGHCRRLAAIGPQCQEQDWCGQWQGMAEPEPMPVAEEPKPAPRRRGKAAA